MVIIEPIVLLRRHEDCRRMAGRPALSTSALLMGEWSVSAAAWTDGHQHEEAKYVLRFVYGQPTDGHASSDTEYVEPDTV